MVGLHPSVKSFKAATDDVINYSCGNKTAVDLLLATNVSCDVLTMAMFVCMDISEFTCSTYLCHLFWVLADSLIEVSHKDNVLIFACCCFNEGEYISDK